MYVSPVMYYCELCKYLHSGLICMHSIVSKTLRLHFSVPFIFTTSTEKKRKITLKLLWIYFFPASLISQGLCTNTHLLIQNIFSSSKNSYFLFISTSVFSCCFLICFGGHDAVPDRILEDWAFDKVPIITGSIH